MDKQVSYVIRGSLRKKVISSLTIPNTPTLLAKKINIDRGSVSRTLINLQTNGLVICSNPKERAGRIYKLTEKGKKVQDVVRKM